MGKSPRVCGWRAMLANPWIDGVLCLEFATIHFWLYEL